MSMSIVRLALRWSLGPLETIGSIRLGRARLCRPLPGHLFRHLPVNAVARRLSGPVMDKSAAARTRPRTGRRRQAWRSPPDRACSA